MSTWSRVLVVVATFAVAAFTAPAEPPMELPAEPPAEAAAEPIAPIFDGSAVAPQTVSDPWYSEYGDCQLQCGENYERHDLSFLTQDECCNQLHLCPDGSYPVSKVWSPYGGWPVFCRT